ncbi:MAG: hypothetical protein QXH88_06915 [Sulfolobales archaeon]
MKGVAEAVAVNTYARGVAATSQRVLRSRDFSKELSSVLDGEAIESIRKDRKSG